MAEARFHFHERLNDFLAPARRRVAFAHAFDRRASVKDMIEALGVPHPEVACIRVNGEPSGFDRIVRDGDRIAVYPAPADGEAPAGPARFVLDANLGTLARYLRLCGFDSHYRNDFDDRELAETSAQEHRILLTRDRDVLKRRIVTHGYFVRSDRPADQLVEVLRRFDLRERVRPLTRCSRCNAPLEAVAKAAIVHRLEPLTARYYEDFRRCTGCDRLYWHGSHVAGIRQLLAAARADA